MSGEADIFLSCEQNEIERLRNALFHLESSNEQLKVALREGPDKV